jgi:hypothetical protein
MTKKRKSKKDWDYETERLCNFLDENDLDREFEQFSQYHFRIRGKVDVWPGSRKFWVVGMKGSSVYQNPKELLPYIEYKRLDIR